MGRGVGSRAGGTLGLLELVAEHREAIDYDLLCLGLDLNDLGTRRLDWCRLKAVLRWLPHDSAFGRSLRGEDAEWGLAEHLLAGIHDLLAAGNWQRAGKKGAPRPKPLPRPGLDQGRSEKRFGTASMTLAEARAFFDRINRRSRASVAIEEAGPRQD